MVRPESRITEKGQPWRRLREGRIWGGGEGAVHFHPATVIRIERAEGAAEAIGGAQPTEDADSLHGCDFIKALLEVKFGPEEVQAPGPSGGRVPKEAAVEGSRVPHCETSTELRVDPGIEPRRKRAERDSHA